MKEVEVCPIFPDIAKWFHLYNSIVTNIGKLCHGNPDIFHSTQKKNSGSASGGTGGFAPG